MLNTNDKPTSVIIWIDSGDIHTIGLLLFVLREGKHRMAWAGVWECGRGFDDMRIWEEVGERGGRGAEEGDYVWIAVCYLLSSHCCFSPVSISVLLVHVRPFCYVLNYLFCEGGTT